MLSSVPLFVIILINKEYFHSELVPSNVSSATIYLNMEKNYAHIRKFYHLTFIFLNFNMPFVKITH